MAMEYVALYQRMGVLACNPPVSLTRLDYCGLNAARSGLWNCVIVCGKTAAAYGRVGQCSNSVVVVYSRAVTAVIPSRQISCAVGRCPFETGTIKIDHVTA